VTRTHERTREYIRGGSRKVYGANRVLNDANRFQMIVLQHENMVACITHFWSLIQYSS